MKYYKCLSCNQIIELFDYQELVGCSCGNQKDYMFALIDKTKVKKGKVFKLLK